MTTLRRIARTSGFRHITGAVRLFRDVVVETRRLRQEMDRRYPEAHRTE